ncbi:LysR family transcriptional regulator [Streptomyces sp. HUAS TT20]|uniref:LysR family transcriptional regulator n=1 Tax=Streptomyces sp. HUAS TT20 TaxID=3447509 RepID=UPI0021DA60C1|nr:LysR family transcriptional regulator [Streptomyces sp. HUAS 15-9]UXY25571.1 LysR family transcriptional regulator [Streptomyces sp. HUAS 15-9]
MELRHLSGFVAVAEELHFGRAAERLHIAQSPLSQQIRLLERDLGVKLFDRTTRSVRLTAAGQALLEPARHLLAEASAVRRTVQAAHLGEVGRVTIGFAGASSYSALPLLTRAVTSELPGIELVLEGQAYTGEALGRIADGSLDVGFVALPARRGISTRVVKMERLMLALPDSHPLARRAEVTFADLAHEPFVTFPVSRGSAVREATVQACHEAGFAPRIVQEAPDSYNLLALVGADVGLAVMVESARAIRLEHVVFRPLAGDDVPVLPIALGWRTGNPSAALKAVLQVAERVLPTPRDYDG